MIFNIKKVKFIKHNAVFLKFRDVPETLTFTWQRFVPVSPVCWYLFCPTAVWNVMSNNTRRSKEPSIFGKYLCITTNKKMSIVS